MNKCINMQMGKITKEAKHHTNTDAASREFLIPFCIANQSENIYALIFTKN